VGIARPTGFPLQGNWHVIGLNERLITVLNEPEQVAHPLLRRRLIDRDQSREYQRHIVTGSAGPPKSVKRWNGTITQSSRGMQRTDIKIHIVPQL
jgi:hypothetical protein